MWTALTKVIYQKNLTFAHIFHRALIIVIVFVAFQLAPLLLLSSYRNSNYYSVYFGSPFIFYFKDISGNIGKSYEGFMPNSIIHNLVFYSMAVFLFLKIPKKVLRIIAFFIMATLSILLSFLTHSFIYV